ncbi:hypothetical protein HMPREF2892_04515 [Aerococcus sp. HMSC061A03]|uniref:uroporphyrinogen decarboxylase family protein n=1 Tax=Aerococcus sp. HMSC061A03 TaxID=1739396 RepID=UPI0008A5B459|nr:uroporphyrinogen decarboxylase family protein [Aerococcus sp. HMSC061A03]OFR35381.1 hypothetical protein HMPREF2892_04515 [Aerococcus sp. HMSC061A03]
MGLAMAFFKDQVYDPAHSLDCARPLPVAVLGAKITNLDTINHWPSCLAALVRAYRQHYHQNYCLLPLNHSLEAEAYGLRVYHDRYLGDRIDATSKRDLKQIPLGQMPLTDNALAASLAACKRLSQEGEAVCFNLTGPFTLADLLYDFRALLTLSRRQQAAYQDLMQTIVSNLVNLGQAALSQGARVLALADPTGDRHLLGPRHYDQVAACFQLDLIQGLYPLLEAEGASLYISLALARALQTLGWLAIGKPLAPGHDFPQLLFTQGGSDLRLLTGNRQQGIYPVHINRTERKVI